jgi:cationic amino acid transporter 1
LCRNNTLEWCEFKKDKWKGVEKGMWGAVMSPYENRYVDVKIDGELSGSVTISLKEGLFLLC